MNEMGHLGYFFFFQKKKNMTLQTWQWGSVREGERVRDEQWL